MLTSLLQLLMSKGSIVVVAEDTRVKKMGIQRMFYTKRGVPFIFSLFDSANDLCKDDGVVGLSSDDFSDQAFAKFHLVKLKI